MGVTAIARLGRPPHPSIALIDHQWLEHELGEPAPAYVRVTANGVDLGVLRVLDSHENSHNEVYLEPRAWLKRVPDPETAIELDAVGTDAYVAWRQKHTRPRRWLLLASFVLTISAGAIELAWNAGKYWDWWHPNDFWAGLSQVAKWLMVALGVGGIALFKDYRSIE